jgi:recombinational DNA repair protein RecR
MAILEWIFLGGVCLLISSTLTNSMKNGQQQQRLEQAFYRLLETENGCISLIQLAVTAKVDADATRRYLEAQVKEFKAELEVDADGDSFYRFPKLRRSQPESIDR